LSTELNRPSYIDRQMMEALEAELVKLQNGPDLSQTAEDVEKILEQLVAARNAIATGQSIRTSSKVSH
jgi:hypothetical protein